MDFLKHLNLLVRYKTWANEKIFDMVSRLPEGEALRPRTTSYKNMVYTLNHAYVIDKVFQAHLTGQKHGYLARNTPDHPPLSDLRGSVSETDQWYLQYTETLGNDEADRSIDFEFIGGGRGTMTCGEMVLHVVNHGTYHRGFVADMMYQAGVRPEATDLPVFLRDANSVIR
jgi:uncharacterized damage-inducible protein DinB